MGMYQRNYQKYYITLLIIGALIIGIFIGRTTSSSSSSTPQNSTLDDAKQGSGSKSYHDYNMNPSSTNNNSPTIPSSVVNSSNALANLDLNLSDEKKKGDKTLFL